MTLFGASSSNVTTAIHLNHLKNIYAINFRQIYIQPKNIRKRWRRGGAVFGLTKALVGVRSSVSGLIDVERFAVLHLHLDDSHANDVGGRSVLKGFPARYSKNALSRR